MLYLVDGYNVTRSDPATRDLPLEAQRGALVARLRARGRELLGSGRIVVVFDGVGGIGASVTPGIPVEVRFSRDEIADDLLSRLAATADSKVVLVSSDRELASRVGIHAPHGMETRGRETLFDAAGRGRARRRGSRYPASTVGLPKGANKVTEELKALWLGGEAADAVGGGAGDTARPHDDDRKE